MRGGKQEPHFENGPPSIRETSATIKNDCARRLGENNIMKTIRPQSVKLLQTLKTNVRGAEARTTF
eukprot:3982535-Pyramimonas_sp.AAC.1